MGHVRMPVYQKLDETALLSLAHGLNLNDTRFSVFALIKQPIRAPNRPMDLLQSHLLDKRVMITQPKDGFRASLDTVFLAAAIPALTAGSRVLDMGTGIGSATLCLLKRQADVDIHVTGVDIQPDLVALALQNAAANDMTAKTSFNVENITDKNNGIPDNHFDHVMMNPPFVEAGTHMPSPNMIRAIAHGHDHSAGQFENWIYCANRKLKATGRLTMIHRTDKLDLILSTLTPRFGDIAVYPLWPHAGEKSKRILVSARKGIKSPLTLHAGMVLHENGIYTESAHAVLRDMAPITF